MKKADDPWQLQAQALLNYAQYANNLVHKQEMPTLSPKIAKLRLVAAGSYILHCITAYKNFARQATKLLNQ